MLRANISIGVQYLGAWLAGTGCVPIFNLMEDAATAEISRAQIWQWLAHNAALADGRKTPEDLMDAGLHYIRAAAAAQQLRVAEQAERFLADGGLVTSSERSRRGAPGERFQWDWPVGWAPLQVIAVEGLRRGRWVRGKPRAAAAPPI
mgnify:CR=1 FL=1